MIKYYIECNGFRGSYLFSHIDDARHAAESRSNLSGQHWVVKWVLVN